MRGRAWRGAALWLVVVAPAWAAPSLQLDPAGPGPEVEVEIRGVWTPPRVAPDWETAVARLAAAHFNVIFPYVCSAGVAYYPSAVLPRDAATTSDCLGEAVRAAQRQGVELHPRLLALQCLFATPEVKAALTAQGRMMVDGHGRPLDWLCPTDPRNQERLLATATEIVLRYPVAGLQLDYFRYPHGEACVCERCRRLFEQSRGRSVTAWPSEVLKGAAREEFLTWRRGKLTELLAALRGQLRALRPEVRLSVAVFPNWSVIQAEVGQDPREWARQGLVDFLCPMDYTADNDRFGRWVAEQRAALGLGTPLAAGIGAFSDAFQFADHRQLEEQIRTARKAGASGFVVFNYNERLARDFLPWLARGLTAAPATPWPPPAE